MSCIGSKIVSFFKKMLCCGSDTSVEVDVKTTCKIECCSTHNGNENSTTVIDSPNESRRDSRRDSPALHPNRSLRESPVISREGSIRIDTPDILQLNRNINQSPLLKQTRLINNNI